MRIYESETSRSLVDWQWFEPSLRNITDLILKHVPGCGGYALDIGCGTGRVAFRLVEKGYRVYGIDIEPRVIEIAKQIARRRQGDCHFRVGDFRDPREVTYTHYDIVVCSEVLEHVRNYKRIIKNMYESLKPGGRLIITVPYDMRKFSELDVYGGHLRRFELDQIKTDMARFNIRKIIITGFPFYRLMVRTYLIMIRLRNKEHSNEELWDRRSTRIIAHLVYPFMKLDNLFAFTCLGDALIVVADK